MTIRSLTQRPLCLKPPDDPQIAFHRDAPDRFKEGLRYGHTNKSELLVRLGVPGPWRDWKLASWDLMPQLEAIAPDRFFFGGRVYRLASGGGNKVEANSHGRFTARFEGVQRLTQQLDAAIMQKFSAGTQGQDYGALLPRPEPLHSSETQALLKLAKVTLKKPIPTVLDKTEMPPSGNRNDYYSLPRQRT